MQNGQGVPKTFARRNDCWINGTAYTGHGLLDVCSGRGCRGHARVSRTLIGRPGGLVRKRRNTYETNKNIFILSFKL